MVKTFSVMLLAFICGIAVSFARAQQKDVLIDQAVTVKLGERSIPDLLAGYREMIRREPQNPLGYVLAATVYTRPESRTLYEKAISVAPDFLPAHAGLGRYLLSIGNAKEALPNLRKAMALAPEDAPLRAETISAAVRSGDIELAKSLAGENTSMRAEIVLGYIDAEQFKEAKKSLGELGLESDSSLVALNARGRVAYYAGQKEQGIALLMDAWRKSPDSPAYYRFSYPRRSLVQLLNEARRQVNVQKELAEVYTKGLELFPKEYPLYEGAWKAKFAEVKSDYSAERQFVKEQVETLLKTHSPNPELYKVAALGYKMAELPDRAEQINQNLKVEFPYSSAAQWVWRGEASREKDLRKKLALIEKYNRDFLTITMHKDYFDTLVELNVPNEELLKGAELYIANSFGSSAIMQASELFIERKVYLDKVAQWLAPVSKRDSRARLDAWSGRLGTVYAHLLLTQGRLSEAERVLRPIVDLKTQGFSGVDRGNARLRLAQVLEAKRKLPAALEMYAQAFAESQHYVVEAGASFKRLYLQLKGGEKGMEAFLAQRDDMYAVVANSGIERGSKIDKPAPDFNMMSLSGARVSLASLKGKVVIVNFWATWCGPCIKELPHFQEFADKMKDDPGVAVLAVTTDENRALVAPFIRQHKYRFTVLFNEGVSTKFGVRGIPATFIIDPEGVIRLRMVGFNMNEPLVPYLEKLVAQFRTTKEDDATK